MPNFQGTDGNDSFWGGAEGERIEGLGGSDYLIGNGGNDEIIGGDGDDNLHGGVGDDILDGGEGNDLLQGDEGIDTLRGMAGDDRFLLFSQFSVGIAGESIDGGEGIDTLQFDGVFLSSPIIFSIADAAVAQNLAGATVVGIERLSYFRSGSGNDDITGGALDDSITGQDGNDRIDGGLGNDILDGDTGTDTLIGGGGDDTLRGAGGGNTLYGGDGDDTLHWGGADALIDGGAGNDLLKVENYGFGDFTFELVDPSSESLLVGTRVTGIDRLHVFSASGNDRITGGEGDDSITGGSGQDILTGRGGNDILSGGEGVDELRGGAGDDFLHSYETSDIAGDSVIDGGEGFDRVELNLASYSGFTEIDLLVAGRVSGVEQIQFLGGTGGNRIFGADADDLIRGGTGADELHGRGGNDSLYGRNGGADILYGGDGDDFLDGGDLGGDQLYGGAGQDVLRTMGLTANHLDGGDGDDQLSGGGVADTLIGGAGNDWLSGDAGNDRHEGGAGDDLYVVESQGDVIVEAAGEGTDTIETGLTTYSIEAIDHVENLSGVGNGQTLTGNGIANAIFGAFGLDHLRGGGGDDVLNGSGGNDVLTGGSGADRLTGGVGADRFVYAAMSDSPESGMDRIFDFQRGSDKIDLTALGPIALTFTQASADGIAYTLLRADGTGGPLVLRVDGVVDASDVLASAAPPPPAGTAGDDLLEGTANADTLSGLGGNDRIYGLGADDSLDGGTGNDLLDGGAGDDRMVGGAGDDIFLVDSAGDTVVENAAEGIDEIQTALSVYSLAGLANVENLTGTSASGQTLTGNDANNIITGGAGGDVINAGGGDDLVRLRAVPMSGVAIQLNGGDGTDTLDLGAATSNLFVTGGGQPGSLAAGNVTFLGFERLILGSGADLYSTNGTTLLEVRGGGGNDRFFGNQNVGESFYGEAGDDQFDVHAGDRADGGDGNDLFFLFGTGPNTPTVVGGDGIDTVHTFMGTTDLLAGTSTNTSGSFSLTSIEDVSVRVLGTGQASASGTDGSNTLSVNTTFSDGRGGFVIFNGRGGDDVLTGGTGNDVLTGGAGSDRLTGSGGADRFVYLTASDSTGPGDYIVDFQSGSDKIDLSALGRVKLAFSPAFNQAIGNYTLLTVTTGAETMEIRIGGTSVGRNDIIADTSIGGTAGDDVLEGTAAADEIYGFGGNDTLRGLVAGDILDGGTGDDILEGGAGDDRLIGGEGADRFLYLGMGEAGALGDFLVGFTSGSDKIDLSALGRVRLSFSPVNDPAAGPYTLLTVSAGGTSMNIRVGGSIVRGDVIAETSIAGTAGDDSLDGTAEADEILGLGGNDILRGFGADDVINGGTGNDLIDGGTGADAMTGGTGDDVYIVDHAGDTVTENADEGSDEIRTNLSTFSIANLGHIELLTGTSANGHVLTGNAAGNVIIGSTGNDVLTGGGSDDRLVGGSGADRFVYLATSDSTGQGDFIVAFESGSDKIDLSALGRVQLSFSAANNPALGDYTLLTVTVGEASMQIRVGGSMTRGDVIADTSIAGTEGDDVVEGTQDADIIFGLGGNDILRGFGGNDRLDGGSGADEMVGALGDDVYVVDQTGDVVTELAGEGIDTVRTALGSKTDPALIYALPTNVEILVGTSSGDQGVRDNALDNVFTMGAGNDLIVVDAGGIDTVNGGAGHDFIYFGNTLTAADRIDGGTGTDRIGLLGTYDIVFEAATIVNIERLAVYGSGDPAAPNTYAITLNDGNVAAGATLDVFALSLGANETLKFLGHLETNGSFNVQSGAGSDIIAGGLKNDIINGNGGNDILYSLNGDDNVSGGAGDDMIYGGGGNDRISGGAGKDLLNGGFGNDSFFYAAASESTSTGHDTIHVFDARVDRIDLPTDAAWNGSVSAGTLSTASFDADLAAAVDGLLGPSGAVLFTPDAGDRAGRIFAVVDGNGDGSYTAGADYVIEFTNPLVPLTGADIFI